jgi:hypothetical protein
MRPRYTWEATAHIDDVAPGILPRWMLTLVTAPRRSTLSRDGTSLVLREGERNGRFLQIGCALRRYGIGEQALRGALEVVNHAHCTPPLDAEEVAKIAASAARYAPAPRCDACGAPLLAEKMSVGDALDEDALMARALGVVVR